MNHAVNQTPMSCDGVEVTPSRPPLTFVSYRTPTARRSGTRRLKRSQAAGIDPGSAVSKIRNACVTCRKKKTRCSGHKPCIRCEQTGQECQYMSTVSDYRNQGSREERYLDTSPAFSKTSRATNHSQSSLLLAEANDENPPGRYRRGDVTRLDIPDESLQEDQNGHIHGGASEFAFMHLAKQRLARLPAVSIDFSDHPLPRAGGLAPVLPPKDTTDHLIARYFDFGLSTTRLVHKPSLVSVIEKVYAGELCKPDELALAYIVLALGSHYSNQTNAFCGHSASVRFYDIARVQLAEAPDLVTLRTSQTRFLIIHYLLNHARMHEAWSMFGIVVRHIQALGLHRRSRSPGENCIRHEYRKRLFWSVYINDRILSGMFGRPLAMHDDDIDQDECALANDEDIEESICRPTEDGVFCLSAALVHYARLARILGQILRTFYTPSSRQHDISRLYASITRFEEDLQDWQAGLPPYLNYVVVPQSAASTTAQRQMCTLKLMFAHANLLLYRPFILHAINKSMEEDFDRRWTKRCHERSIEAAQTVVSECRYLSQRGLFSRTFWLVTYMQFASIGTLLMYSYLWPEDAAVRRTVEEAIEAFPSGIDGDPVGQRYLATLKELRGITIGVQSNPEMADIELGTAMELGTVNTVDNGQVEEGPWTNFFFDTSLIDEMMCHNENA